MKRQEAFTGKNKMLKGGLHNHSTRSDGALKPDELIRLFKKNGYDFLALTDHRIYNYKNFAPETGMTIIPGMEMDNGMMPVRNGLRCFHTLCLGVRKESGNGYEQDRKFSSSKAKNQEEFQPELDEIHRMKNITVYCHPEWSGTPARYFESLKGNFAMEIWNSGCVIHNDMDKDAAYWDEILGQGRRIFGVATDDGHAAADHCHGWVMVNAENNIDSIISALSSGAFYSSCGPEIYDFHVKGDKAVIECSEAVKITVISQRHPTLMATDPEGLTRAEIKLDDWAGPYDYVRAAVTDKDGKQAWTNPIFLDEEYFK